MIPLLTSGIATCSSFRGTTPRHWLKPTTRWILIRSVRSSTTFWRRRTTSAARYDAAIEEAQQIVKLHPGDVSAQFWLGSAYAQKKMYAQAVETFQRARKLSGDAPVMLMAYGYAQGPGRQCRRGTQYAEKTRSLRKVRSLPPTPGKGTQTLTLPFIPSLYLAAIHVGLGETDDAFASWISPIGNGSTGSFT